MTDVNFEPTPLADNTNVNFEPTVSSLPSVQTAAGRAQQFHQGLSHVTGMDVDDVHAAIASGKEDDVRQTAAMGMDEANARLRLDTLRTLGLAPNPDVEALQRVMKTPEPVNPATVAEQAWGYHFVNQVAERAYGGMKDSLYGQAVNDYPHVVEDVKRRGGIIAAQNQYIQKYSQDAQDAVTRQGASWYGQRLASFIPLVDEVQIRHRLSSLLPGIPSGEGIFFGEYMAEASRRLLTLPFPQFTEMMDNVFGPWVKDNPQQAGYVLHELIGQSTSDRYLQNFWTAMDLTSVPGVGTVGKGIARIIARNTADSLKALEAPKQIFKGEGAEEAGWSNMYEPGTKEWYAETARRAAQGAGDTKEAGIKAAATEITKPVETRKTAVDALTSNFRLDLDNWTAHLGHGGQELSNRITAAFRSFDVTWKEMLGSLLRVDTISDLAQAGDLTSRAIYDAIKDAYKGPNNSISNVSYKGFDQLSGTHKYELEYLDPSQNAWATKIQAEGAKKFIDTSGEVVPEGMGWKITRTVGIDRRLKAISDLMASKPEGQIQKVIGEGNPVVAAAQRFRTPKEVLSYDENMQREVATHAPWKLLKIAQEELEPMAKMPKGLPFTNTRKMWRQFNQALEHSKHLYNDDGVPGRWFRDGEEMDDFYLRNFDRQPQPIEKQAYLATVRTHEMERAYNTIRLYSNKAQNGFEEHVISYTGKDGKKVDSEPFEARIERNWQNFHIPADATIYVQVGKGPGVIYRSGVNNPITKKIQKGELVAAQIYNPDFRPLSKYAKIGDKRVQWVITDKFKTSPLDWEKQIPRRGGGHFVYDYNYYIKQARIGLDDQYRWYEGDTTLMPIAIRKMGQDIVNHLNIVREHLLNGREAAAKDYHNKSGLPFSWDEHRGWYKETTGAEYKPARLSMKEPIHLVPKDKMVVDMDEDGLKVRYGKYFRDSTREGNPARQMQVQFTGERDARELLNTIKNEGSRDNPLLKYQPADFADPIHVMNRSMVRAVQSIYMQDMKNYSMLHWLKQAVSKMDVEGADKLATVMHSPAWHFNNPRWLRGWENSAEVAKLEAARYQMKQFIGVPSKIETALHGTTQHLADMLYGLGGERIVPSWLLSQTRDPLGYLRSAIVHMKLGLFNPQSFFVQASTHVNIWGIAGPKHAAPGTAGMYFHTLARVNASDGVLKALGKKAERMGYRPGEWEEAYHELINRGFYNVGHTHAFFDAPYQTKVIKTKLGYILDAGHAPFREGAQSVRTAAWYTAYHEWRNGAPWTKGVAHATGKLSKQEWDRVLSRAADLDHNMSRAANSGIQAGLMSFPMQFQTYHLRLLELMTGKRLTRAEKTRLVVATTLAYGLPIGGLGLLGSDMLPVWHHGGWTTLADYFKQTAQENGYTPNESFIKDVFMRGLPDAMLGAATGEQTNIAERWGPGKFDVMDNLVRGNLSWWKLASGATGQTVANMWANSHPLIKSMSDWIQGKSDEYPMTASDWIAPLEEISSVSSLVGFINTINTGRLWSKQGKLLNDVEASKWKAAIMRYVIGLTPQRISDAYGSQQWRNAERELEGQKEGVVIKEMQEYLDDLHNNDPQSAAVHWKRAQSEAASLPPDVKVRAIHQAIRTYGKSLPDIEEQKLKKLQQSLPQGQ